MLVEQKDVFYYVTMMNENYAQPDLPVSAASNVVGGCYHFKSYPCNKEEGPGSEMPETVTLLGSGAILTEVIKAAQVFAAKGGAVDVFSVTRWSELARDGQACAAQGACADADRAFPFVTQQLHKSAGPVIAASDYVRAVPESIRAYLPAGRTYVTLGTDGFGRSDTRAALRSFFGVDAAHIVQVALESLN